MSVRTRDWKFNIKLLCLVEQTGNGVARVRFIGDN